MNGMTSQVRNVDSFSWCGWSPRTTLSFILFQYVLIEIVFIHS